MRSATGFAGLARRLRNGSLVCQERGWARERRCGTEVRGSAGYEGMGRGSGIISTIETGAAPAEFKSDDSGTVVGGRAALSG